MTHTRSCKDTERISPGPLQERLSRTCTRSCKGLWKHFTRIPRRSSRKELQRPWARSSCQNPEERPWQDRGTQTVCEPARRNGHGHVTRAISCENSEGNCRAPRASKARRTDFARAFAVGTHVDSKMMQNSWRRLCEPPQSKRTWTCHKSHFMREFAVQETCRNPDRKAVYQIQATVAMEQQQTDVLPSGGKKCKKSWLSEVF